MSGPARALAVLGPALALGAWVLASGLLSPPAPAVDDPAQARMHARYAANPSVVVIGNSQAHSAIDPDKLADLTHTDDDPVLATVGGAFGPVAYVTLTHQVLPHGTPKLVLVAMTLDHLLDTTPPADGFARAWFDQQLSHPDPVLDDKVFGATWPAWRRAVDTSAGLRDLGLAALTTLPLWLVGQPDPHARMAAARTAVLGELGGAQFAAAVRVMPLGSTTRGEAERREIDLDRTLLPDMVRAATDAGAQLLFVTLPVQTPAARVDPTLVRRVASWAQEHGAGLLHLEGVAIPSDGWLDGAHMNARGQDALTEALGNALLSLGGPGHLKPPPLPLDRPTLTARQLPPPPTPGAPEPTSPCRWRVPLTGATGVSDATLFSHGLGLVSPLRLFSGAHELTAHSNPRGDGCTGGFFHADDGLWVAPAQDATPGDLRVAWAPPSADAPAWVIGGSTLVLSWQDAPPSPDDAWLQVVAQAFSDAAEAPVLTVGGASVPLKRWGDLWMGSAPARHSGGPWQVQVSAPAGVDLLLTGVVLHAGVDQWLLGEPTPTRLDVAGAAGVVSAPALAAVDVATAEASGRELRFVLPPPWDLLDDDDLAALGDRRMRACHPFEAFGPAGQRLGPEALRVDQGVATVTLPEATPPEGTWTLRQRPVRDCKHHTLVAPGETVTLTVRSARALPVAVDQLSLTTTTLPPGRVGAQIGLTVDGAAVLAGAPALAGAWTLSPVGPHPARVALSVTAPADAWLVVGAGALEAATPPAFAQDPFGPQSPPRVLTRILLRDVLREGPLRAGPATATVSQDADTFTLRAPAGTAPYVCVQAPAGSGAATVTLSPSADVSVALVARWLTEDGEAVGKAAQVRQVVPAAGGTITLPLQRVPGAAWMNVCLWRGATGADLRVTGWEISPDAARGPR